MLRGSAPRHAEQLVNAAGLAILAIGLTHVVPVAAALLFTVRECGREPLPAAGRSCLFAAGCGLIAYGAVDRAPGPAYLGVREPRRLRRRRRAQRRGHAATGRPLILLLGVATMVAGLRPRAPLPPEPPAYRAAASRSRRAPDEEEPVRARRDD